MPYKAISNTRRKQLWAVDIQLPTCLLLHLVLVAVQQHEGLAHDGRVGFNSVRAVLRLHGLAQVNKVSRVACQPA
jgi:hypothetical protein